MRATAILFDRISVLLNRIALTGAVTAVLVMAFAAAYQVVARYIFDAPPVWTEEIARRAMVWAGMLGASVAFREKSDPTLFPGALAVTGRLGGLLALVRAAGVAIFAFPVVYYCLFGPNFDMARGFLGRSIGRTSEMLGISMVWFNAAVPVAFVLILFHTISGLLVHLTGARKPYEPEGKEIPA